MPDLFDDDFGQRSVSEDVDFDWRAELEKSEDICEHGHAWDEFCVDCDTPIV